MQSAFWLARQIRIVLEDCVKVQPPQERVKLVEALARAIDSSGNDAMTKCTVVIGEGTGMDILGRIWLPYDLPQVRCSCMHCNGCCKKSVCAVWMEKNVSCVM